MTTPRTIALAALISLAPFAAACGGGDDTADSSTTSAPSESPAASTPTEDSASGAGSSAIDPASAEFCAASLELESVIPDNPQPGQKFTDEQIEVFERVKAAAPAEISESVATVLDGYAEQGYTESLFSDPEFTAAGQEIAVFVQEQCEPDSGGSDAPAGSDAPVSNDGN